AAAGRWRTRRAGFPRRSFGWYQEDCTGRARHERYGWLPRVGWLLFAVAVCVFVFGGCLVTALDKIPGLAGIARACQVVALIALFAPLAGHLLSWQLSTGYQPNEDDVEERKRRGEKRAMKPPEYARRAPKPAAAEPPPQLRMEDP